MDEIIRSYPKKKQLKEYPKRYSKEVFEQLNIHLKNEYFEKNYNKLKMGVNPDTNKKIKIDGKTYKKIKERFMISCSYKISNGIECRENVLYEDIKQYDQNKYLYESELIFRTIDEKNSIVNKYNLLIDNIVEQINKLKKWDEFVKFEGKKYGTVDKMKNNIHIENNCNGLMLFSHKDTEYIMNDRPFCNYDDITNYYSYYKCNKCNYVHKIFEKSIGGFNNYISKTGFWWK